ncbi:protein fimG [Escherichia coli 2-222-05_S3_C2]|nr:protein fimG [Escherichia coli 2-222-05_S3_C1]KEN99263.1 protein fimG [Escherichia coli 2-222-05_S3_C2]
MSLTDCPVETSAVTAIVTGSTDNTGYYKNEGTAENIQIELRDDQDAALKNGDSKTVIVDEMRSLVMHSFHLRQELSR